MLYVVYYFVMVSEIRRQLAKKYIFFQWHGLSREEQAKYYDQARKERQLHMQMYPGWSARDNYAQSKKKKRKREAESSNYYFFYLKIIFKMILIYYIRAEI